MIRYTYPFCRGSVTEARFRSGQPIIYAFVKDYLYETPEAASQEKNLNQLYKVELTGNTNERGCLEFKVLEPVGD